MAVVIIFFMILLLIGIYVIERRVTEIRHYLMLRDGYSPTTWAITIHSAVERWKKEYKDSLPQR